MRRHRPPLPPTIDGFVLRNDDENPGACTNLKCVTTYFDPVLEITYS